MWRTIFTERTPMTSFINLQRTHEILIKQAFWAYQTGAHSILNVYGHFDKLKSTLILFT